MSESFTALTILVGYYEDKYDRHIKEKTIYTCVFCALSALGIIVNYGLSRR